VADSFVAFASGLLLGAGSLTLRSKIVAKLRERRAKKDAVAARERALQRAEAAEALLKARGYKIVARDAPASYAVTLDGEPLVVNVAADFLIEQEGKRFVAEVKVGAAAKLDAAATRWQFLEQQHAFGTRSVLVVDPDAGTLSAVRFPLPKTNLTAVATPPKPAREASALAQKKAKEQLRATKRRRLVRYAMVAAAIYAIWWMLRDPAPEMPPAAGVPRRARPMRAAMPDP
jgi:hypothetical protein